MLEEYSSQAVGPPMGMVTRGSLGRSAPGEGPGPGEDKTNRPLSIAQGPSVLRLKVFKASGVLHIYLDTGRTRLGPWVWMGWLSPHPCGRKARQEGAIYPFILD